MPLKSHDLQQHRKIAKSTPLTLLTDIRQLIDEAREVIAATVNTKLALLYWHIGQRVRKEVLQEERAEYGQAIVVTLSRQLVIDYGKGFSEKNLRRMIQFAEIFPEEQIVVSLTQQLSWSHFTTLIPLKDATKRDFYAEMCRVERWSVKGLKKQINAMLYERTALSKQPEATIK